MILQSRVTSYGLMLLPLLLQGPQASFSQDSSAEEPGEPQPACSAPQKPTTAQPAPKPDPVVYGQARPTRARYRVIQQALADAGCYSDGIDGIWGDRSEAALKRYQEAADLTPTGRLDALTLIRLGLGPQYESPDNENDSETAASATPPG